MIHQIGTVIEIYQEIQIAVCVEITPNIRTENTLNLGFVFLADYVRDTHNG